MRSGSTLYYALLFAPAEKRGAIAALHALASEIEEVAHASSEPAVVRTKLDWWKQEVTAIAQGKARHPLARAVAEQPPVPHAELKELVAGAELDLAYNAYPDFEALESYLQRTGGALAAATAEVLGYSDARTRVAATDLGIAVKLTRIIRNVREDVANRRIYLPLHELAEFGVTTDDLEHARETDSFRKLVAVQVERAEESLAAALAAFPAADRKRQHALLAIAAIHRALLREIRDDGYHVLTRRVALTPLRKLWLAWRV